MKQSLFVRRQIMVRSLALGNDLSAIVMALSREFRCSQAAIYKDYERMSRWIKFFVVDNHLVTLFRARLEFLFRRHVEIILDESENVSVRLRATNQALKIVKVQVKLGFALGLIKRQSPLKRNNNFSRHLPFQFHPIIKQALLRSFKEDDERKNKQRLTSLEKKSFLF
jgi:hypothetical protein